MSRVNTCCCSLSVFVAVDDENRLMGKGGGVVG